MVCKFKYINCRLNVIFYLRMSAHLQLNARNLISKMTGRPVTIDSIRAISGGSINNAFKISFAVGEWFMKTNSASRYPGMFESEAKGLKLLLDSGLKRVPEVIGLDEADGDAFLFMQWLEPAGRKKDYWEEAGSALAKLHKVTQKYYGLDHDNYIGSLPQKNNITENGTEFMINMRYDPLVRMAVDNKLLDAHTIELVNRVYKNLDSIMPDETSALLHGDLWSGNIITGPDGYVWFIDPAVYYGYRETDLAMTKLFGGFDISFYSAYNDEFPLGAGWEQRVDLFQLYPLLVHLVLFGTGYRGEVLSILKKYA